MGSPERASFEVNIHAASEVDLRGSIFRRYGSGTKSRCLLARKHSQNLHLRRYQLTPVCSYHSSFFHTDFTAIYAVASADTILNTGTSPFKLNSNCIDSSISSGIISCAESHCDFSMATDSYFTLLILRTTEPCKNASAILVNAHLLVP